MACACGRKSRAYTLTTPTGEKLFYNTEVEAAAAQRRKGGTIAKPAGAK